MEEQTDLNFQEIVQSELKFLSPASMEALVTFSGPLKKKSEKRWKDVKCLHTSVQKMRQFTLS